MIMNSRVLLLHIFRAIICLCSLSRSVYGSNVIKNIKLPSCKNCIYHRPSIYNNHYISNYDECIKFGEKNIVTDKIQYECLIDCRSDESKCGIEGKYFQIEKNMKLKIIKYQMISYPLRNIFTIITLFLLLASAIVFNKN